MQNSNLPVIYEDPYELNGDTTETLSSGNVIRNNLKRILNQGENKYRPLESVELTSFNRRYNDNSGYIDPRETNYPHSKSTIRDILDTEIQAANTLQKVKNKLEEAIELIEPFEEPERKPSRCCCFKISW